MKDPRVAALRLLGKWQALAGAHVALAAGCSCGVGVTNLRAADFEQQILDYLRARHAGNPRAAAGDLGELLRALAETAPRGDKAATLLLADIERTLASFEQQHSGR